MMMKALPEGAIQAVEAEIDRQHIQRSLLRVAVNNTKSTDDYDCMIAKARYEHRMPEHGWLYNAVIGLVGLACIIVYEVYDYLSGINREE